MLRYCMVCVVVVAPERLRVAPNAREVRLERRDAPRDVALLGGEPCALGFGAGELRGLGGERAPELGDLERALVEVVSALVVRGL